jgi:hypothetical protein
MPFTDALAGPSWDLIADLRQRWLSPSSVDGYDATGHGHGFAMSSAAAFAGPRRNVVAGFQQVWSLATGHSHGHSHGGRDAAR